MSENLINLLEKLENRVRRLETEIKVQKKLNKVICDSLDDIQEALPSITWSEHK
jgi:hypothetical protein